MRTLHQTLRLQHHRHTGRMLHHKHTSYHGLAIVLVLAVGVMAGLNMLARAAADTITGGGTLTVYASKPAPIPTDAAVITSPADGTIVNKAKIVVEGTCPDITPAVVVGIIDNGSLAGSTPCTDGSFSIPIVIEAGRHTLIAKTYTITGDNGPDSDPVIVFYTKGAGETGTATTESNAPGNGSPLMVTIDEPFIVFGPGKDGIWLGTITGGTLPYQVHIDWGDGKSSSYKVTKSGQQQFAHHYRSMRPHIIELRVTDAAGRAILRDYAAVTPYTPPTSLAGPTSLPWNGSTPWGLYGAYLLLLVVFGGLWARAHPFAYAKVRASSGRRAPVKHSRKPTGR